MAESKYRTKSKPDNTQETGTQGTEKIVRDKNGQFAKGHSGNPKGAPRTGERITDIIKEIEQRMQQVKTGKGQESMDLLRVSVYTMFMKAIDGDVAAMNWIAKYRDGLPAQRIELSGEMLWGDLMQSPELNKATGDNE